MWQRCWVVEVVSILATCGWPRLGLILKFELNKHCKNKFCSLACIKTTPRAGIWIKGGQTNFLSRLLLFSTQWRLPHLTTTTTKFILGNFRKIDGHFTVKLFTNYGWKISCNLFFRSDNEKICCNTKKRTMCGVEKMSTDHFMRPAEFFGAVGQSQV